ncbi:DUF6715 family protein [Agathobacter sp.]
MKKTGIVIIALVAIIGICGAFYAVNENSKKESQKEASLTEIQKITTKDLDKDYPQTPREVVKFYNKIVDSYYKDQYTDDELDSLTDQALKLFDDELVQANPKDSYKSSVVADVKNYKDQGKTIAQIDVCDSNDVKYATDSEDQIAYVRASYFIKQGSSYSKTYQDYVLRKDSEGRWKILTFYKIASDSDTESK